MSITGVIAVSGLSAASLRLQVSASSIADAASNTGAAAVPRFGASGLIASPKFDFANELIQQLMGRFALTANAQVLRADARMTGMLLDITI
jgi:flagellar basal body rod protein FlgC